ncbi:MAG: hypothetical protein WAK04_17205 [Xanthobacteraceae bacterium]
MPSRAIAVYAVAMVGERERDVAACYFARGRVGGTELIVLDADLLPLAPAAFSTIVARLRDLGGRVSALAAFVYCTEPVAREFARVGVRAELIDMAIIKDELPVLTVAMAGFVWAEQVKLTSEALAKSERLPGGIFSPAASLDENLRVASMAGVVIGLDPGRSLAPRRERVRGPNANLPNR